MIIDRMVDRSIFYLKRNSPDFSCCGPHYEKYQADIDVLIANAAGHRHGNTAFVRVEVDGR